MVVIVSEFSLSCLDWLSPAQKETFHFLKKRDYITHYIIARVFITFVNAQLTILTQTSQQNRVHQSLFVLLYIGVLYSRWIYLELRFNRKTGLILPPERLPNQVC